MTNIEKLIIASKRVLKYMPQRRGEELCEAIELASRDIVTNQFNDSVDELIRLNHIHRTSYQDDYNYHDYLREFCTIKYDPGRNQGKTAYIKSKLSIPGSVALVGNESIRKQEYGEFSNVYFEGCDGLKPLKNPLFTTIYIDEPSLSASLMDVYQLFSYPKLAQTFVFLGK